MRPPPTHIRIRARLDCGLSLTFIVANSRNFCIPRIRELPEICLWSGNETNVKVELYFIINRLQIQHRADIVAGDLY